MAASINKENFIADVIHNLKSKYGKYVEDATQEEMYNAVATAVKDLLMDDWIATRREYDKEDAKIVYYMSMEFLPGRFLGNDIINLCAQPEIREALDELGFDLNVLEDQERDPALGNGGLGRLASCFLDSLATLGYPAYGCGIRYRYGMFRQEIKDGYQTEVPDIWLKDGYPMEVCHPEYAEEVKYGGYVDVEYDDNGKTHFVQKGYTSIIAVPYEIPIVGYGNGVVNTLRIWDARPVNEFNLGEFDRGNYEGAVQDINDASTICEVLYPNDNYYAGKELRLKQQYFFVSASIQRAIAEYKENHDDIKKLYEKVVFQLNDTHPTITVAELMRILIDEEGLDWDEAWAVTTKACAYTNHTIMSEALEKWPVDLFSRLLPRVYQIVEEINRRFVAQIMQTYPGNNDKIRSMAIIYDGQIRMANLAIVGGFSVNGVARLHTEILKNEQLADFYQMMPEKFNNKTNGITQRRFLLHGNPLLSSWVTDKIGDGWITDLSQIKKIADYADDASSRDEFMDIKYQNKVRLAAYIKEHNGIEIDPNSMFDIQVKRIHEYKRQFLNILQVMYLYNELKENPDMDIVPKTFIFGGKSASAYARAKLIIKLINSVADVINNDASIGGKIKVVYIEDYCVSNGELLFAAADVSEQISTASKEASGTGNMKFMLNGALTIGTMDGANVEMAEEVGQENMFIFGASSDEIIGLEKSRTYNPWDIFNNDPRVNKVLTQLIDGTYSPDDPELFRDLYNSLLYPQGDTPADQYFVLLDFASYCDAKDKIDKAYRDKDWWAKAAMLNTACSGKFSSDRTIEEYVKDIGHLNKIQVKSSK